MRAAAELLLWCIGAAPALASAEDAAWVDEQRARWGVPGVVAAVVSADRDPEILASGLCDVQRGAPCSSDSGFPLGSATKTFTALLAVALETL